MPDTTPNLALPYILPSQAQKHVTHNEALQHLDAVVQLAITASLASPPAGPAEGACYLVSPAATGLWSGKDGRIAVWQDGAWVFHQPQTGWRAWFVSDGRHRILSGGTWTEMPLPAAGTMDMLGIVATPDATNRLSIASPAILLNHAGHGHQVKINKALPADTASLLFQTNWSGRAEMGLAGNDDFSVKTSADGSTWVTALTIGGDGQLRTPRRPMVRASLNDATLSPASGTQTGFQQLHVNQGSFSLGTAISGGTGNRLVVPVTGLYMLHLLSNAVSSSGHTVSLTANGTVVLATIKGANSTASVLTQSATALAPLTAGDWLAISHAGTAQFEFGKGKTELVATMM